MTVIYIVHNKTNHSKDYGDRFLQWVNRVGKYLNGNVLWINDLYELCLVGKTKRNIFILSRICMIV